MEVSSLWLTTFVRTSSHLATSLEQWCFCIGKNIPKKRLKLRLVYVYMVGQTDLNGDLPCLTMS